MNANSALGSRGYLLLFNAIQLGPVACPELVEGPLPLGEAGVVFCLEPVQCRSWFGAALGVGQGR